MNNGLLVRTYHNVINTSLDFLFTPNPARNYCLQAGTSFLALRFCSNVPLSQSFLISSLSTFVIPLFKQLYETKNVKPLLFMSLIWVVNGTLFFCVAKAQVISHLAAAVFGTVSSAFQTYNEIQSAEKEKIDAVRSIFTEYSEVLDENTITYWTHHILNSYPNLLSQRFSFNQFQVEVKKIIDTIFSGFSTDRNYRILFCIAIAPQLGYPNLSEEQRGKLFLLLSKKLPRFNIKYFESIFTCYNLTKYYLFYQNLLFEKIYTLKKLETISIVNKHIEAGHGTLYDDCILRIIENTENLLDKKMHIEVIEASNREIIATFRRRTRM